jgi:subtilisin family serine protease
MKEGIRMKKTRLARRWAAVSAVALAACGGGGGDAASVAEGAASAVQTGGGTGTGGGSTAGSEVVLMLQPGAAVSAVASTYSATVLDQFGKRPIWRLRLAGGASLDNTLSAMRSDARIVFAEPNAESETPEGRKAVVWAVGGDAASYGTQWAPDALALSAAHTLSTGAGMRVAVLDTGIDANHPALSPRLARTPGGTLLGHDFVDDDDDPSEGGSPTDAGWGHGTHVAGLVALAAPGARLMPARVLDAAGRGNAWVLAEALMWAVDPDGNPATDDGAHVVNISLGTLAKTRLLNTAVELATCSDDDDDEDDDDYSGPGFEDDQRRCDNFYGTVVMAAAGNGGNATETHYPAAERAEGQLAVTATNVSNRLASFSNFGPWVQLAAPGEQIISTFPGGGYATWSGTSMATPLAAGVAALVLARNPSWKPIDVTKRLLDRGQKLCGTSLLGLHAHGAVADFVPPDASCP